MYEWKPREEEIRDDIPTDNSKIEWYPGCKGCAFALEGADGYRNGSCRVYPFPESKPHIYAHQGRCPDYEEA